MQHEVMALLRACKSRVVRGPHEILRNQRLGAHSSYLSQDTSLNSTVQASLVTLQSTAEQKNGVRNKEGCKVQEDQLWLEEDRRTSSHSH